MLFTAALALISASVALAGPLASNITERTCGTAISAEKLADAEARFALDKVSAVRPLLAAAAAIQVYWHVISEDSTAAGGYLS
jgi:hypothetical protein